MRLVRRLASAVGALAIAEILFAGELPAQGLPDPFPQKAASYLVTVNGKPLWARSPDKPLPPASLTKVMTALLVLERGRLDEIATVGPGAERETGSRIGLKAGDRMKVGDLLAAAVIQSANDACRALAEHVGGSEARFVAMMNRRAAALGLSRTRFANACGHDGAGHLSTARDLARLAEAALAHKTFSDLAATVRTSVRTADGTRAFDLENKNELIGRYPGAIGVKSGFTAKAGKCVIALAERDNIRVMLVLLGASERWWNAEAMLDRAFAEARKMGP